MPAKAALDVASSLAPAVPSMSDAVQQTDGVIRIRGARQNNLRGVDVDIRTGELTVVTGPSGSGKSSLVFDTLYAEGQRRYVETFSAYARQFLDRMDKPAVDKVEGVPPAIAIDQTNPVRTSRSTVGTMTELNDHLKLFFARFAHLHDRATALPVQHDNTDSIYADLQARCAAMLAAGQGEPRLIITFAVVLPAHIGDDEIAQWLSASGFTRIHSQQRVLLPKDDANAADAADIGNGQSQEKEEKLRLQIIADRLRLSAVEPARVREALELALRHGQGQITVFVQAANQPASNANSSATDRCADSAANQPDTAPEQQWAYSSGLHCPQSGISYRAALPGMFSFNSAAGACAACKGFGRVIGVDWGLVIPDEKLTLRQGAIKPIQTPAWVESQHDLLHHAEIAGIPRDTPWSKLTEAQQRWVIDGAPNFKEGNWSKQWYGVARFFGYLESKAYKMHIRVMLSKYRSYTECPTCQGARLQAESLLWRVGSKADADAVLPSAQRHMPHGTQWSRAQLESLPGLCLHDMMQLPLERLHAFFERLAQGNAALNAESNTERRKRENYAEDAKETQEVAAGFSAPSTPSAPPLRPDPASVPDSASAATQAQKLLFEEITHRLHYLCDVGLGYLTLDRQSRTLSGGEVQRINLTTALGTSLVNTLFVLDEPSIGLHPRDMQRIITAMQRLRDAGNTLVVVEHDPAIMWAADRMLDMGPGPGARGGQIVFDGSTAALKQAHTLTGDYLSGRKQVIDLHSTQAGAWRQRAVQPNTPRLLLEGARQHNLQNISLEIPLQRLVCITGVSGSGKSTLMQDVLAPALLRHFGKATEAPGAHDRLLGADHLSDVVFVDQSPIGKTARSNPASYVGAWDAIRQLFATAPLAQERGYTASKFSFNSGDGRCPTCGGSGFEHVEMQFLSDVYLRCPDCNGQRYRPELLEVRIQRAGRALNVADVLELTVHEATQLFAADRQVLRALQPIVDVGLDYVKLGQPVPTLSGGEAQRLKLAGFLAQAAQTTAKSKQPLASKGTLFLFDEPTTGLHFDDIAKLMRAFAQLLDIGHSLIVIEHNLDVIRASDWLIDMGPEGGSAGGQIVAQGTPDTVRQHASSHTGAALRDYDVAMGVDSYAECNTERKSRENYAKDAEEIQKNLGNSFATSEQPLRLLRSEFEPYQHNTERENHALKAAEAQPVYGDFSAPSAQLLRPLRRVPESAFIDIRNAHEHNLKNLSVRIPRGQLNVITGVSGSGKSTLAFDIIFNEGQRRYLESLNAYARSLVQPAGRPDVDAVYGIPPAVAIEQRLSRGGRKSTVGTTTEVWHFLRLLYVKLGVQHCIHDGHPVQPQTPERIVAQIMQRHRGEHIGLLAPLVTARKGIYTELADWALQRGYSHLRVDGEFLPTQGFARLDRFKEHNIELPVLSLDISPANEDTLRQAVHAALQHGKGVLHVLSELHGLEHAMQTGASTAAIGRQHIYSTLRACPVCSTSYAELDPRLLSYNSKHGWCAQCVGTGVQLSKEQRKLLDDTVQAADQKGREQSFAEPDVADIGEQPCTACQGTRLNATARAVLLHVDADTDTNTNTNTNTNTERRGRRENAEGAEESNLSGNFSANSAPPLRTLRSELQRPQSQGISITDLAHLSVSDLRCWLQGLQLAGRDADIARDLLPEIAARLDFLEQVGLGYLTLDRGAPTLSGGEAQRIRLAAQLGSNLQGVCYVLDEPTIGLHPRDNRILINALQALSSKGNTLLVVEHDEDTIRAASHIIDIGPGAGVRGGTLVAQGTAGDIAACEQSITGRYLRAPMRHPMQPRRAVALPPVGSKPQANQAEQINQVEQAEQACLIVQQANLHNLQHLTVQVPLHRLVAVTGVSGSGKSTLARDVLLANVQAVVQQRATKAGREADAAGQRPAWLGCSAITGYEVIARVLEVDQTPIGKTPRSCPATYIGFWDDIRKLFAQTLQAKAHGFAAGRFSFNTGAGRCPACEGQGMQTIEMSFLPDVKVPCEVCRGARFNPQTLGVTWRGKTIGDVLQMEVDEAVEFFATMPQIAHPLQLLQDVGLGYLTLGQPSPTLSGGEAQRIKLVTELSKVRDDIGRRGQKAPHTLYVLDEPTVGLHMSDVEKLIGVLHRLVNAGHSVLVIEHDLDVIAEADWVLDLGPEGGSGGGRLVAAGTPEDIVRSASYTGVALAPVLAR